MVICWEVVRDGGATALRRRPSLPVHFFRWCATTKVASIRRQKSSLVVESVSATMHLPPGIMFMVADKRLLLKIHKN